MRSAAASTCVVDSDSRSLASARVAPSMTLLATSAGGSARPTWPGSVGCACASSAASVALNSRKPSNPSAWHIRTMVGIDTPARTASVSTDCSSDSSGASRINRATPCCAGESAGSWARKALSRGTENEGMGDTWAANRNERRQCSGSPAPRRLPEGKPPRICKPAVYAQSPFRGQRPGQRDACGALPVHA